ncbi:hypothetical protein [Rhizobium redzepovicii]|uniref:hypothetical protein n=1 Tax=Rhizobium redzepovicii TaxID=2867518 RepID=UPI001C92ED5D|nr:hypothetical protein [Rhizobium redzepovicii]MBY4589504.1 hypothetical protein [Rhizobium redzepovicii]
MAEHLRNIHSSMAKAIKENASVSSDLLAAIDDLERTHDAWMNSVPRHIDLPQNAECEAFNLAEEKFIKLPCRSYADVLAKVRYLHDCKTSAARTVFYTFQSESSSELLSSILGIAEERAAAAPSDPAPASMDFSDVFYQIGDLAQLLGATHDILNEVDYREPCTQALERVTALQRIARDMAETLYDAAAVLDGPRRWVRAS